MTIVLHYVIIDIISNYCLTWYILSICMKPQQKNWNMWTIKSRSRTVLRYLFNRHATFAGTTVSNWSIITIKNLLLHFVTWYLFFKSQVLIHSTLHVLCKVERCIVQFFPLKLKMLNIIIWNCCDICSVLLIVGKPKHWDTATAVCHCAKRDQHKPCDGIWWHG